MLLLLFQTKIIVGIVKLWQKKFPQTIALLFLTVARMV